MTLIERIAQEIETDTESPMKQSKYLRQAYAESKAIPGATRVLDDAFVALCGYSLTTLLQQEQADRRDEPAGDT